MVQKLTTQSRSAGLQRATEKSILLDSIDAQVKVYRTRLLPFHVSSNLMFFTDDASVPTLGSFVNMAYY